MNAIHRAGVHAHCAGITLIDVQFDPAVPGQSVVGTRRDTFVIFARQAYLNGWYFRPFTVNFYPRTFGRHFSKMRHGTDGHANFTFGTQRALDFEHFILGERIV
jgi:hypothetical protein